MKRNICSLLMILCLLAGLMTPIYATESLTEETAPEEELILPEESLLEETEAITEEAPAEVPEQAEIEKRSPPSASTSAEGITFITEFLGKDPSGTKQLSAAEDEVNTFIKKYNLTLNQKQFDALVDFVIGTNTAYILSSGYRCEKVTASGSYTDAELAEAFCAWVKDGNGNFSESNLARRLREIKLFLYGSYDGVCAANFRYVIFDANGGTLNDNTVLCYTYEGSFANLPTASRSGYYFAGWYTAPNGGTHLCNGYTVNSNYRVYARWSASAVSNPNEKGSGESQDNPGGGSDTTPGSEHGAGITTYPDHPEWPQLPALKISEAGVQFIKDHEGFAERPMWDYAQYSVGYGSRYDLSNPSNNPIVISDPITRDEADYLLRYYLSGFEPQIDKILAKGTVKHTQAQYDAIVSLTYNLGQQWVNEKYQIYKYILFGGCTETDFVNTIGSWCNAGGGPLAGLCKRRMEEADLYFNGDYTLNNTKYRCIVFNAVGGSSEDNVEYYRAGTKLGWLPLATKSGNVLVGWFTKTNGGDQITVNSDTPTASVTYLYAHWIAGTAPNPTENPRPTEPPETTRPTEPTEPSENPALIDSRFADVKSSEWYYTWVTKAVDAGLFGGISETTFAPEATMTRAMLVTVLYRMEGSPAVSGTSKFTDVPADEWYSDAVIWASENGIVNGATETRFAPEQNLLREQLAAMLLRYAIKYNKMETAGRKELTSFADRNKVSEYALDAMQWSFCHNIIGGSDGLLLPDGNATRAQCAKMLVAFYELTKS